MTSSTVHVVHCIDTEGPLHEPLWATFLRLKEVFGIDLPPSTETLKQIQRQELNLGGCEAEVATVFSDRLLAYNDTWDKIDSMLAEALSPEYRNRFVDSSGNGWIYNWFCLDVVGYQYNLRRRDMGFHNIYDHYREILSSTGSTQDGVHFHHHPVSFTKAAHHYATHYFSHTPVIFEILARRIIERQWFPCANRPGFNVTRPDSHWLMEQYIPFDIASQATNEDYSQNRDLAGGRLGDWRRAPLTWTPYHPDHDDYQTPGSCRRWITRCLSVGSRARLLTEVDIELAFQEAAQGKPVVLAFTNHDYRDIRPDVEQTQSLLKTVSERYPNVPFKYCEARDAMRSALGLKTHSPLKFSITLENNLLHVKSDKQTFGPQPFLALKTHDERFLHDNFDFQIPFREWTYTFDEHSMPIDALEKIGIGSCDELGNVTVSLLDLRTGTTTQCHH